MPAAVARWPATLRSEYIENTTVPPAWFHSRTLSSSHPAGMHHSAGTPPASTSAYVTPSGSLPTLSAIASQMSRIVSSPKVWLVYRSRAAANTLASWSDSLLAMAPSSPHCGRWGTCRVHGHRQALESIDQVVQSADGPAEFNRVYLRDKGFQYGV